MAKYVKISPLTRLEGHLGITARVKDGTPVDFVSTAYSHGEMFRGLEKILIGGSLQGGHGRDPRDAPVITSRTCGVCHFIHRHVSLRNIENAAGWAFPAPQALDAYGSNLPWTTNPPGTIVRWLDANRNLLAAGAAPTGPAIPLGAQLARNIVHLVTYVYSHAAHTIALAAPDYKCLIDSYVTANAGSLPGYIDPVLDVAPNSFFDNFLQEAVVAQRILHEILGYLGGKVPHQQSAIPGGFSRSFTGPLGTGGTDMDIIAALASKTIALGGADPSVGAPPQWPLLDLSGGLDAGNTLLTGTDWICNRVVPFTLALAVAGVTVNAVVWGVGSNNFVCAPTFDIVTLGGITGDSYFRGGVAKVSVNLGAGATVQRFRLDPTQEDAADIDGDGTANWMTIWEDITSGKYPYQDDYTGYPKCGGYKDDFMGPLDPGETWQKPLKKPGYPGECETHPAVDYECPESRYMYTWYKATRVKDDQDNLFTVESGPLARLVVNGLDPHLNLAGFTEPATGITFSGAGLRTDIYGAVGASGGEWMSSTWNRLMARLQDALLLIDMLIGSNYSGENTGAGYLQEITTNGCWLTRLDNAISALGVGTPLRLAGSVFVDDTPPNGAWESLDGFAGCGYWDAPRGITCHFCKIDGGRLSQYQHIAGTSWNGNGRDSQGNPGPFEWSLMNYQPVTSPTETFTDNSGGNYTTTLTNLPVVERSVRIEYELYEGNSWKRYVAYDVPKVGTGAEGEIKGHGLESSSKIDYYTGAVELQFTYNYDFPDYSHVKNVTLLYYGYAGQYAVPTPSGTQSYTNVLGNAVSNWDSCEMGYHNDTNDGNKPNPLNILRTIRSYDPCLACSIHVIDRKGKKAGKYEVLPVAGWDI